MAKYAVTVEEGSFGRIVGTYDTREEAEEVAASIEGAQVSPVLSAMEQR